MKFAIAASLLALASTQAYAQVNAGNQAPEASVPFKLTQITTFNLPWRMEATADLRNMLAQGYLPLSLADGRRILLIQNPRTFRGGLSFIF